jgi:hypothetical protein
MSSCQSCGMPLEEKTTSKFDPTECIYCQDQTSGQLKTYEEVRSGCIKAAVDMLGKTEEQAVAWVNAELPKLPRWQKQS